MIAASPFPLPRGSQVLIAGLADSLHERGHRVEIATYPTGADSPVPAVPVHRLRPTPLYRRLDPGPALSKPLLDLLLARKTLAVARRSRPDLLHAHNFEGLLVGLWVRRKTGVPVIYHLHNLMEPELPAYFRFRPGIWAGRWVGRWVDVHLPRRADACIALHDEAAAHLRQQGVAPERVHVVPPGVHLPETPPLPPAGLRRRRGRPDGPIVLYSGNLDRYQDLDFLLEAFGQARAGCPEATLVLATHQTQETRYSRALQRTLGQGAYLLPTPSWDEMRGLLAAADVVVSPRQVCWGFPIKVLNYMAAGCPIVAAAGSAQGLRHMATAWIVPNGDVAAFARGIQRLLEDRDLAGRLGQAARSEVQYRHGWPTCARAIEQVYQTVTATHVTVER